MNRATSLHRASALTAALCALALAGCLPLAAAPPPARASASPAAPGVTIAGATPGTVGALGASATPDATASDVPLPGRTASPSADATPSAATPPPASPLAEPDETPRREDDPFGAQLVLRAGAQPADSWQAGPALQHPRAGHAAGVLGGSLVVVEGDQEAIDERLDAAAGVPAGRA